MADDRSTLARWLTGGSDVSTNGHRDGRSRSVTAAATKVDIGTSASVALVKRREEWQDECWDVFDTVGEVKYAAGIYLPGAMSRLGLYVGLRSDAPDGTPVPVELPDGDSQDDRDGEAVSPSDARQVIDTLDRLATSSGGHGEILGEVATNLTVAGECYLWGRAETVDGDPPADDTPAEQLREVWDVRSVDEVTVDGQGAVWVADKPTSGTEKGRKVDAHPDDMLIRIWQRHPRWSALADSPLRGVLSSAEELLILEQAVRSIGRSRLNAGIIVVPEELTHGPPDPTVDSSDGEADSDPFLDDLMTAMTTPIQDEGSASAVVPMMVEGKAEYLKELRHITIERKFDDQIETRTERALKRLAQGLNVPVEIITGMADVNHWTSWPIEDSTFKSHLAPLAELIVNALTVGYLHPMLQAAGVADPDRFVIWYDPTRLVARTNVAENAVRARDRGAINNAALRRALGFTDADASEDVDVQADEAVIKAIEMVTAAPSLVQNPGLPTLVEQLRAVLEGRPPPELPAPDDADDADAPDPDDDPVDPQADPTPDSDDGPVTAAGPPRVDPQLGDRLARIDRDLRIRLQTAADATMLRALEKAGANIRSRARQDRATTDAIEGVDNDRVAATLGPTVVQALGADELDLLDGAFDQMRSRFHDWVRQAQYAALALVPDLDDAAAGLARQEMDGFRDDAWTWFRQALMDAAQERLYDPDPEPDELGEFDGMLVDLSTVREAVARAGGAFSARANVSAAGLDTLGAAVGIATGPYVTSTLADRGVQVDGWQWVYGPYPRTQGFAPHEQLDGTVFAQFDDPVLANSASWPPEPYFIPGDHPGCLCDVAPVTIDLAAVDDGPDVPVAPTPAAGPNRGRADDLFYDTVDPVQAAAVALRRHGGGGYTAQEGRWYIHRVGEAWAIERQTRNAEGVLTAERAAVVPMLTAARTFIARNS